MVSSGQHAKSRRRPIAAVAHNVFDLMLVASPYGPLGRTAMHDSLWDRTQRAALTAAVFASIGPFVGFLYGGLAALIFGHHEPRLPVHNSPGTPFAMIFFLLVVGLFASPLIYKLGFLAALVSGFLSGLLVPYERPIYFLLSAILTGAAGSALLPEATLNNADHPFLRGMVVGNGPEFLAGIGAVSAVTCAFILIAVTRCRAA